MDSNACNFAARFTIDGGGCIFSKHPFGCDYPEVKISFTFHCTADISILRAAFKDIFTSVFSFVSKVNVALVPKSPSNRHLSDAEKSSNAKHQYTVSITLKGDLDLVRQFIANGLEAALKKRNLCVPSVPCIIVPPSDTTKATPPTASTATPNITLTTREVRIKFVANSSFALAYGVDPNANDAVPKLKVKLKEKVIHDLETAKVDTSKVDVTVDIEREPGSDNFVVDVVISSVADVLKEHSVFADSVNLIKQVATSSLLGTPFPEVAAASKLRLDTKKKHNEDGTFAAIIAAVAVAAVLLIVALLLCCCCLKRAKIYVRLPSNALIVVSIRLEKDVRDLKQAVFKKTGITIDSQTVTFAGENLLEPDLSGNGRVTCAETILNDGQTLAKSGLVSSSIVQMHCDSFDEEIGGTEIANPVTNPRASPFKKQQIVPNVIVSPRDLSRRQSRDINSGHARVAPLPANADPRVLKQDNSDSQPGRARVAPLPANADPRVLEQDNSDSQSGRARVDPLLAVWLAQNIFPPPGIPNPNMSNNCW